MKYAGRSGHNPLCEGASALLNEVIEDRKISYASKKYISISNTFIYVTPSPTSGQNNDLNYGIKKANDNEVDIFYSVHLNKCYDAYSGAIGSEIWLYDENSKLITQANRILKNLEKLGFKNRSIKYCSIEKKQLAELHNTKMPSMIIECFFLEATKDVELYKKIGADRVGQAISEGLTGKSVITQNDSKYTNPIVIVPHKPREIWKTVIATALNVRSGQGTGFSEIGKLHKGDKIKIDKSYSNGWTSVYFGNNGGYVSTQYLK